MFKRTLALLLAACMMFDSSAITTLAAEPQTEVVSEVEAEETEEVSEDVIIEEETSSEIVTETEVVTETEEVTETEVVTETEEVTETEVVTETEEVTETEVVTETEEVTEEEVVTETEEVTETEAVTETEEIVTEVVEVFGDAEYSALVFNTLTAVTIPASVNGDREERFYSFTAPEAGYYNFHVDQLEGYYTAYLEFYADADKNNILADNALYTYADTNIVTKYLQQGECIYANFYSYASEAITANVTVKKLAGAHLVKQEDGSYTAETDEYALSVNMKAGYKYFRGAYSVNAEEGVEIRSEYGIEFKWKRANESHTRKNTYVFDLDENGYGARSDVSLYAEQGTEYEMTCMLLDWQTDEPLAFFEGITLTTGTTDEPYVIYETTANETSIVFDAEFFNYITCYYAPTDGSEEERRWNFDSGWREYKITGLQPDTEYYFEFVDNYNNSLGKETVKTVATTATFTYEATYNENGYLALTANMSNYQGNANYAYFYYKYVDALDRVQTNSHYVSLQADENGTKSFSCSTHIETGVLGGTEYDIELWVQLDNVKYGKAVKTLVEPAAKYNADDITLSVTECETAGRAEYTVSIAGLGNDEGSVYGTLYYKPQEESQYNNTSCYVYSDGENGTGGGQVSVQAGIPYDYVLIIGGVKKEVTATIGTPTTYLTKVEEHEVHPFDWVSTFKVESTEELADTYYLRMFYFDEEYDQYQSFGSAIALNAENAWQTVFKTADNRNLMPGTEYKVKWTLSTSTSTYGTPLYTLYETIQTPELELELEVESSKLNLQRYTVALKEEDAANLTYNIYLYAYIREQGSERYQQANSVSLGSSNGYSNTLNLGSLKAETTYEVSLRDGNGNECTTWTFTTPEDTRSIAVSEDYISFHNVRLNFSLSNMDVADYSYILAYVREEGTNDAWYLAYNNSYSGGPSTTGTMYINWCGENQELKDGTTYEYKVGFGTDYSTPCNALTNICEGTFTTKDDARTVSANASAGYATANLSFTFSGNEQQMGTNIYSFYKPQNATTWILLGSNYAWDTTASFTRTITGLTSGTSYDYAVVISDNYCTSPDEVTDEGRKVVGTFTTKENTYELEFKLNESKLTYEEATVTVTAKGGTENLVNVVLTLSDASGAAIQATVALKAGNNYTKDVTFEDLLGSTEYTISSAQFIISENGYSVDIGTKAYTDFKFTTKEAVAPTAITLNKSEMLLNCIPGGVFGIMAYNAESLIATIAPKTAADDVIWTTSNPNVASVTDDGRVRGQAIGTATITVTSRYCDADGKYASASCEVTVKKYAVGRVLEDGIRIYDGNTSLAVSKNGTDNFINGIGFYEVDANGNPTLLEDYTVTTAKEGIAVWDNGTISAIGLGDTDIVFEKDGIKAGINVRTYLESVGFSITGFESSASGLPAVLNEDGSYTLAWLNGTTYSAIGMNSPVQDFEATDFNWTIADTNIATVDEYGVVTVCGGGTTTLTVAPKDAGTSRAYAWAEEVITLHVLGLPRSDFGTVYAITNVDKKLSDVEFPDGTNVNWSWKNPDTPLVTNGINRTSYYFEAVYGGTTNYPLETGVEVYIGKINGVSIYEAGGSHNQVLLTSTEENVRDSITLNVGPAYEGTVRNGDYTVEIPEVKNLTITQSGSRFTITALKAGSYTLKPVIKVGEKVVAKGTYKITAVDVEQAASISLVSMTDGVTIDPSSNKIIFKTVEDKKDFELKAIVNGRNGLEIPTKLKWNTSDKSVITVKADSKDSHIAKVTAKGEGHAVITVVADDKVKYQVTLDVEIRNHAPRVSASKASVNTAYDYNNGNGWSLAAENGGLVEIVPVYGGSINSVQLYDKTGTNVSTDLRIQQYGYNSGYEWLVMPIKADLKNGTYDCTLCVSAWDGEQDVTYNYPLKVSVTSKKPSVKASMSSAVNLFYTNTTGDIKVTGTNGAYISSITWEDTSEGANNGFTISNYGNYGTYCRLLVSQQADLSVAKGKLTDTGVAKGTLTVKLNGYREAYTYKNFSIKTNYKKPSLVSTSASTTVVPDIRQISNAFNIYDKTNKTYLSYDANSTNGMYYYNEFSCDNEDVVVDVDYMVHYTFNGTKNTKLTLDLDATTWRESLSVTHSINVKKPKVMLGGSSVTFNTTEVRENLAYVNIYLDNERSVNFADITIEGADAKSKDLMAKDLLVLEEEGRGIRIEQKDAATLGQPEIKAGTYKYKLTPYYISEATGEKTALNTLTLSVKIITKPVTVKVSPSGSIDLSNGTNRYVYKKTNAVWVDPKFSNTADGDYMTSYRLVGEYSRYFMTDYSNGHYYVSVSGDGLGKLRAGQSYKLAMEYTMKTTDGETYTVTSNTFSVKTKQSKPKITVGNNKQTMYAAADNVSRTYYIYLPNYYSISSAYGSLDCNKDGVPDIRVNLDSTYGNYSNNGRLTVSITDCDGVVTSASGKSYTIPVTVQLRGRDGITKDATVNINVTVKR